MNGKQPVFGQVHNSATSGVKSVLYDCPVVAMFQVYFFKTFEEDVFGAKTAPAGYRKFGTNLIGKDTI